jgi:uncharacterized protein YrrD
MLRSLKELYGYALQATDGEIGTVEEFYFDDEKWAVRYLVANAGSWLTGRLVLISPLALGEPDWGSQRLPVKLTREQIRNSPDIDTAKPISRQHEIDYYQYYGWPYYWAGAETWGVSPLPLAAPPPPPPAEKASGQAPGDTHLRSSREVEGYHIQARDGEIGHAEDFIVDDETWRLRYLVVDTRNWWPGKKVLVAPEWISGISWEEALVRVDLTREAIKAGPEFDPGQPINREYEARLYDYYGRPVYWA